MRSYLIYNHNDMEGAFHDMANIMKNLGMTSITARFYLSDGYATELADNGACKLSEPIYEKKITNKSEGTLHCFYMMVASVEEKSYKDIHFDKSTIACKTILLNYKNQWFGFKNRYNDKTLSLSLFNDVTDYRILDDNAYGTPPKKFSVLTNKVIDKWINYLNQRRLIEMNILLK